MLRRAFTLLEILMTVTLIWLVVAGILKVQGAHLSREKYIRTKAEMATIALLLEKYREKYGDYPKLNAHDDFQGDVLCSALKGVIDPEGGVISDGENLLSSSFKEIDGKLVDPFFSDYIYYYKTKNKESDWKEISYILISKGVKGQQNPERNRVVAKDVTVSENGYISGENFSDIVLTSSGFL